MSVQYALQGYWLSAQVVRFCFFYYVPISLHCFDRTAHACSFVCKFLCAPSESENGIHLVERSLDAAQTQERK